VWGRKESDEKRKENERGEWERANLNEQLILDSYYSCLIWLYYCAPLFTYYPSRIKGIAERKIERETSHTLTHTDREKKRVCVKERRRERERVCVENCRFVNGPAKNHSCKKMRFDADQFLICTWAFLLFQQYLHNTF